MPVIINGNGTVDTGTVLVGNSDITGLAAGSLPSNVIGAGAVLQVVTASYNTRIASSSTSYSDTGLSVSITPTSASSKILIIGHQADCFKNSQDNSNSIYLRLLRNSTEILLFADRNLLTAGGGIENMATLPFHYLDSPATTSSTTYKTQFKNYSAVNVVSVQQQSSSYSIIIAMEIAA
jgi:hypothetical protein